MSTSGPYLSFAALVKSPTAQIDNALSAFACEMRMACPGIIQAFDPSEQTATVRLALRETMIDFVNKKVKNMQIPDLIHVPVVIPRAGGYLLTLPIASGDECLVVFADQTLDSWWQSGGVQNPLKLRRHNLSDGIAIVGLWSQQRKVSSYSMSSAQLRSEDGTQVVDVSASGITITASPDQQAVMQTGDTVSSFTVDSDTSSVDSSEVDITAEVGNVNLNGDVFANGNLHVGSGTNGTFSTSTGLTVTVQDGIVIDIS